METNELLFRIQWNFIAFAQLQITAYISIIYKRLHLSLVLGFRFSIARAWMEAIIYTCYVGGVCLVYRNVEMSSLEVEQMYTQGVTVAIRTLLLLLLTWRKGRTHHKLKLALEKHIL